VIILTVIAFSVVQSRRGQNSIRTDEDVKEFIETLTEAIASGKISNISKLDKGYVFSRLGLAKLKLQEAIDKQSR